MNSSYYKYCIVPQCKSITIKTPNKLFIYVPNNEQIRIKWLELARRYDAHSLSADSRMYFCEDHFDLPNDMCNYMEYHIMGKVSQMHMKPGCMPSKFECQEDRRKRTSNTTEQSYILKKQRLMTIAECLSESEEKCTLSSSIKDTSDISSGIHTSKQPFSMISLNHYKAIFFVYFSYLQKVGENVQETFCVQTADKSVQALITHTFRSKAVQVKVQTIHQALSPLKPSQTSTYTSPFKTETIIKSKPSVSNLRKITRNIFIEEEHSDSDISLYVPSVVTDSSPPVHSLQIKSSSDCSELIKEDRKLEATETILNTINKIEKKPRL